MNASRFRYCGDPLFLVGCAMYVVNRWLVKPHVGPGFLMFHFNDLWLLACALPPVLWLHRRLGLRSHDRAPSVSEIAGHLVFWSVLLEWIGPRYASYAQGDFKDVTAYTVGALMAGLWWRREWWITKVRSPKRCDLVCEWDQAPERRHR
jgi:hypothetical protein